VLLLFSETPLEIVKIGWMKDCSASWQSMPVGRWLPRAIAGLRLVLVSVLLEMTPVATLPTQMPVRGVPSI